MQKYLIPTTPNIILNFLYIHFIKVLNCFRSFNYKKPVPIITTIQIPSYQ
ncbi:hypothetical protein Hanom_Chr16g01461021 [Helianthus anomalus]